MLWSMPEEHSSKVNRAGNCGSLPKQARICGRCLECWTVNAEYWLQLLWRTHREATLMGYVPSWTSPWSIATWHMFSWTTTWRLRTTYPRSWRRKLLWEDGDSETHKCTSQKGWVTVCTDSLRPDRIWGASGHAFGLYCSGEPWKCWVSWDNRAPSRSALSLPEVGKL